MPSGGLHSSGIGNRATGVRALAPGSDGNLDVVSVEQYEAVAVVRPGNGDGSFQGAQFLATGPSPQDVVVADLAKDGHADATIANMSGNNVRVYLGSASGLSVTAHDFPVGFQPTVIAVGDFGEDGWPDLGVGLR